jgi:hypothetical protein
MNDDRLRRLLAAVEVPVAPAPEFAAELLDELKYELGFPADRPAATRRRRELRDANRSARTDRWIVLVVAAALLVAALGLFLVAVGGRRQEPPEPLRDPLSALSFRWIGAPRDIPTLGFSQNTRLTIEDGSISVAGDSYVAARMPGSVRVTGRELAVTSTEADRCQIGDIGTYGWTLSSGGARLHLELVSDSCIARQTGFTGDWFRIACKAATDCFGDVGAGTYPTVHFGPRLDPDATPETVFGAVTYTLPDGWAVAGDFTTDLLLVPSVDYALRGANGPSDERLNGIEAWARPAAHLQSADCATDVALGVGRTARALTAWLASLPSLESTVPTPITIDGHPGMSMDVRIDASWTQTCGLPQPTVPLFTEGVGAAGPLGAGPYVVGLTGPTRLRIFVIDLGAERTVLIMIRADDPTRFDALTRDATPIVESFRFQ